MKRALLSAAAVTCFTVSGAYAQEDIGQAIPGDLSANVTIASDYIYRGISQTDETPAIQGGFDYNLGLGQGIGIYSGVWASNVDFGDGADSEFDVYAGATYEVQNFGFDFGGIYYFYPGSNDSVDEYDFWELQAAISYAFGGASVSGSINYSPDFYGVDTDDGFYYKAGLEVPIPTPYGISLDAHIGHQEIDEDGPNPDVTDYTDWSIGLNVPFKGLDLRVAYTDTDLDDDCGLGGNDLCGPRAVFSASKSF